MKFREVTNGYLVRIDKNEELVRTLSDFAKEHAINSGFLSGLGGVQRATIGYFELEEQRYHFKTFEDLVEIVSLNGNFALKDGEPFLHLHGTFSNRDLEVVGGHVKEAVIAGTCEVHITAFTKPIQRIKNNDVGLDLLDYDSL